MGLQQSYIKKCNFEDIQEIIHNKNYLLINTLSENEQNCLIKNTINTNDEINIINNSLKNNKYIHIIIYGKNSNDQSIYKKYKQLFDLGFVNIYLYIGGIFEWLCLQDIYGNDEFPTTIRELDLLKYKPKSDILKNLITNVD
jgi:23S rRNA pseudoU1915 N3-methylase RlmH